MEISQSSSYGDQIKTFNSCLKQVNATRNGSTAESHLYLVLKDGSIDVTLDKKIASPMHVIADFADQIAKTHLENQSIQEEDSLMLKTGFFDFVKNYQNANLQKRTSKRILSQIYSFLTRTSKKLDEAQNDVESLVIFSTKDTDTSKYKLEGRDFGFKALSGFELKLRKDGYMTADRASHDGLPTEVTENKVELDSLVRKSNAEQLVKTLNANPRIIEMSAKEYKIHLMPKLEFTEEVLRRVLDKFREDSKLKSALVQYKILLQDPISKDFPSKVKDDAEGVPPRIVLYVESKEDAQLILDAMFGLFTQEEAKKLGCNVTPRLNIQVNSLVYYAQGSGGYKGRAKALNLGDNDFLEEDGVHFKGDYHLRMPIAK